MSREQFDEMISGGRERIIAAVGGAIAGIAGLISSAGWLARSCICTTVTRGL
jgi:hypothetical protein